MAESSQFTATGRGNELLRGDGFYISFRAEPSTEGVAGLMNGLGPILGVKDRDAGGAETALYTHDDDTWRILNGDWRAEYGAAFPDGLLAAVAVYDANREDYRSDWSTDL